MSRVFIPQHPRIRLADGTNIAVDLSAANRFGKITTLLEPGPILADTSHMVKGFSEKLKDITKDDFFIPAGNPIAIAIASMILSDYSDGFIRILSWDRYRKEYDILEFDVFPEL